MMCIEWKLSSTPKVCSALEVIHLVWQGAWTSSGEAAAPAQEIQLAVLQQRLGHKAEAAETEELREELASLRAELRRLQARLP